MILVVDVNRHFRRVPNAFPALFIRASTSATSVQLRETDNRLTNNKDQETDNTDVNNFLIFNWQLSVFTLLY